MNMQRIAGSRSELKITTSRHPGRVIFGSPIVQWSSISNLSLNVPKCDGNFCPPVKEADYLPRKIMAKLHGLIEPIRRVTPVNYLGVTIPQNHIWFEQIRNTVLEIVHLLFPIYFLRLPVVSSHLPKRHVYTGVMPFVLYCSLFF